MTAASLFANLRRTSLVATVLVFASATWAQQGPVASLTASPAMALPAIRAAAPSPRPEAHKFWDKENEILFATVAGMSAADFAATRSNLQGGGKELNPVTRVFAGSTAGLAANFAGETAGVIGLSYLFHRTGHHKLERITSMLNAGVSAGAVAYDLSHR